MNWNLKVFGLYALHLKNRQYKLQIVKLTNKIISNIYKNHKIIK